MRAFLFDLDGTLVDSLDDISAALNFGLGVCGFPLHPRERVRSFIGHGITQLVARAVAPRVAPPELLEATRRYYTDHVCDHGRPYPGIVALVEALLGRGRPMAVLTNKPHALALDVVAQLFAPEAFVTVWGDRDGVPKKPDPAGARAVADELGVSVRDCALVGDSVVDVHTAKAAGMRSIAVTWGFGDREALVASQPDVLVDTVAELEACLLAPLSSGSVRIG